MASSLFNVFGGRNNSNMPSNQPASNTPPKNNPFANFQNFLGKFDDFSKTFTGNSEEVVKAKLASGEMSKEQYEWCCNTANQIMSTFGNRLMRMFGRR